MAVRGGGTTVLRVGVTRWTNGLILARKRGVARGAPCGSQNGVVGDVVAVDGGFVDRIYEVEKAGVATMADAMAASEGQRFVEIEIGDEWVVALRADQTERCPRILGSGTVYALISLGWVGKAARGASGLPMGPDVRRRQGGTRVDEGLVVPGRVRARGGQMMAEAVEA